METAINAICECFNLQPTGDTRSTRWRPALPYKCSSCHSTGRWHPARKGLSKRRGKIAKTIAIAIRGLYESARMRMHGHRPSPPTSVGTHVHAITHVHAWRGITNERSPGCTLHYTECWICLVWRTARLVLTSAHRNWRCLPA